MTRPTLRLVALGAVSGAVAGLLFGVSAFVIQTAITQELITRHGYHAVDHGAAFLQPGLSISMSLLGAFVGILYVIASECVPRLGRFAWIPRQVLRDPGRCTEDDAGLAHVSPPSA